MARDQDQNLQWGISIKKNKPPRASGQGNGLHA